MEVRMLVDYEKWRAGTIVSLTVAQAKQLIDAGFAEEVKP